MADPVSVVGLVIAVTQVLSSLYDYGTSVEGARDDIRLLSAELFALKGVLEHLHTQHAAGGAPPHPSFAPKAAPTSPLPRQGSSAAAAAAATAARRPYDADRFAEMLQSTHAFLLALLRSLDAPKKKGLLAAKLQRLAWPLNRADVERHVARLERAKSWFILVLMTDSAAATAEIYSEVVGLARAVRADMVQRQQHAAQQADRDMLQRLAPVAPDDEHRRASSARQKGTGQWFVDGPLRVWLRGSKYPGRSLMFWLKGKSGMGKTTLFSRVVEELLVASSELVPAGAGVAYFYCTFDNAKSQEPVNVLGSITAQLTHTSPSLCDGLRALMAANACHSNQFESTVDLQALEDLLVQHVPRMPLAVILVDAVNESAYAADLVACLGRLVRRTTNLRVLVTTTEPPPSEISELVEQSVGNESVPNSPLVIHLLEMQPRAVRSDIAAYIDSRLAQSPNLRHLSASLQARIKSTLEHNANGSFRWVRLSLDHLSQQRTGKAVRQALHDLPTTLQAAYARTIARIPPADRALAREALLWLSFALWPLSLTELSEAVVLEEPRLKRPPSPAAVGIQARQNADFELGGTLDNDSRLHSPQVLLEICRDLIDVDAAGKLSLAHSSIKTYLTSSASSHPSPSSSSASLTSVSASSSSLTSSPSLAPGPATGAAAGTGVDPYFRLDSVSAHQRIMRKCLAYLCLDEAQGSGGGGGGGSDQGALTRWQAIQERFHRLPLLRYAVHHWALHVHCTGSSISGSSSQSDDGTGTLDASDTQLILRFLLSGWPGDRSGGGGGGYFGNWVQLLLPDTPLSAVSRTQPLYYAASFELLPLVRVLLRVHAASETAADSDDDAEAAPPRSRSAGRARTTTTAAAAGAAAFRIDEGGGRFGSTPLFVACYRGHIDVVRLLLDAGADPLRLDSSGHSTLTYAEMYSSRDMVQLLRRYADERRRQAQAHGQWQRQRPRHGG